MASAYDKITTEISECSEGVRIQLKENNKYKSLTFNHLYCIYSIYCFRSLKSADANTKPFAPSRLRGLAWGKGSGCPTKNVVFVV